MMNNVKIHGFTLIEMAISILILGIVAVMGAHIYDTWITQKRIDTTNERIAEVHNAINLYIQQNSVLPCVSSLTLPPDDPAYGVQAPCTLAGIPPGAFRVPSNYAPLNVEIGAVPVRTLNIPDEYMEDAWGRRFIYAMTEDMALSPVNYRTNSGGITLVDTNGNNLISPSDTGMYVIASTGPNGRGGYTHDRGVLYFPCDATAKDGENCDNDSTFTASTLYSEATGANYFDDYVIFEMKEFVKVSAVSRYLLDNFLCTAAGPGANAFGQNCATVSVTGANININVAGGETPRDGVRIYNRSLTSETDGRVVVRAAIPAIYSNAGVHWEEALLAAVYVNGALVSQSLLIDPASSVTDKEGYSGMIIGTFDGIVQGAVYNIEIFIYSFGNNVVNNVSAWVGTVKHTNYSVDGSIEILEIKNL